MQAMDKALANDPETKDRYEKATNSGKEWFCFSRWVAEDMSRWNDAEAVEYRDALASRLASTDIVFVLLYETNLNVVAYLKELLVVAVERETTPEQRAKRGDWTCNARKRWRHITANPPQETKSWMGSTIQIGGCFYSNMLPIKEALSEDSDTKQPYEALRDGGKEWLCYSWWIAEDRTRWDNPEAVEYRKLLMPWLEAFDIVNVLQFETDGKVITYLKKQLAAAIKRETSERGLAYKAHFLAYGLKELDQDASRYAGHCGGRLSSVFRAKAEYLRGNPPGAGHWTHPNCKLYLKWFNKYDAPTSGLCRVQ